MFYKQFLAYAVHIDWCYHSIHKHSSRYILTCSYMMTSTSSFYKFFQRLKSKVLTQFSEWIFCVTIEIIEI